MVLHHETNRGDLAALLIASAAFYWREEEASEPKWREGRDTLKWVLDDRLMIVMFPGLSQYDETFSIQRSL